VAALQANRYLDPHPPPSGGLRCLHALGCGSFCAVNKGSMLYAETFANVVAKSGSGWSLTCASAGLPLAKLLLSCGCHKAHFHPFVELKTQSTGFQLASLRTPITAHSLQTTPPPHGTPMGASSSHRARQSAASSLKAAPVVRVTTLSKPVRHLCTVGE
jgi:hypothetical protein